MKKYMTYYETDETGVLHKRKAKLFYDKNGEPHTHKLFAEDVYNCTKNGNIISCKSPATQKSKNDFAQKLDNVSEENTTKRMESWKKSNELEKTIRLALPITGDILLYDILKHDIAINEATLGDELSGKDIRILSVYGLKYGILTLATVGILELLKTL